jgi:hypothetical protein
MLGRIVRPFVVSWLGAGSAWGVCSGSRPTGVCRNSSKPAEKEFRQNIDGQLNYKRPEAALSDCRAEKRCIGGPLKARYFVTKPTHWMAIARRILPQRALDRLLSKASDQ